MFELLTTPLNIQNTYAFNGRPAWFSECPKPFASNKGKSKEWKWAARDLPRTRRTNISIYSPRHFNSSSQTIPFPAPKPALTTALVAFPMFNILHTTLASTMSQESSQTVPYLPLWRTWHRRRCHLTRVQLNKTRWSAWKIIDRKQHTTGFNALLLWHNARRLTVIRDARLIEHFE